MKRVSKELRKSDSIRTTIIEVINGHTEVLERTWIISIAKGHDQC